MTAPDLIKAKDAAVAAARLAGKELRQHWGNVDHQTKGHDLEIVTDLDRRTETFLANQLLKFDRKIGFRGEEFGSQKIADINWLVDPIDGTIHFIRGLPFCTTMIALVDKDQVLVGVIYDFINDQAYWAIRGQGAFKDDQPLKIKTGDNLSHSILILESNPRIPIIKCLRFDERLIGRGQGRYRYVLNLANSGWDFIKLATGQIDGRLVFHGHGYDYDYAPGSLIIQEAGGVVTNLGSTKYDYNNLNLLAARPILHKEMTTGDNPLFPVGGEYQPPTEQK